jgi:ketosteroid isomerase-like protein
MSQENVEVARAIVAAVQRGDWQAAIEHYDPDVELDMIGMPESGRYSGRGALWAFYRQWFGAWDRLTISPQRFIDVDDRVVVIVVQISGVGRGSGVASSMRAADVLTLRDGKVVRQVGYTDAAEALEAVGLPEQAPHADS